MRKPAAILIVPSPSMGATYNGIQEIIYVSTRTVETLTQRELDMVLHHEHAHRNLFHTERAIAILMSTLVSIAFLLGRGEVAQAGVMAIVGGALHALSVISAEFEADWVAMQRAGGPAALLSALTKMAGAHQHLIHSRVFLMRVRFARWVGTL